MTRMKSMKKINRQGLQSFGGGALTANLAPYIAFTLAEMMVVLLIISIILACMAPVMTTKMKADQNNIQTSPWKWARNNIDAYFSAGSNQAAMIGQNEKADSDSAKLIINNNTGLDDMILFKNGENVAGHLSFGNNSLLLGGGETLDTSISENSVAIGISSSAIAGNSVSVGFGSSSSDGGTALGYNASTSEYGTAIGSESSASVNGIAIGKSSNAFDNSIVIGNGINNQSDSTVVIGRGASVTDTGGVAVGSGASAVGDGSAFGHGATAKDENSIAIGYNAQALHKSSIAIGTNSISGTERDSKTSDYPYSYHTIAIGNDAVANGGYGVAIGYGAKAPKAQYLTDSSNVAIGHIAMGNSSDTASVYSNVAVGHESLYNNQGSSNVAVGYRAGYGNTTGTNNVAIGILSLFGNTTGRNNIGIGDSACRNVMGSNKTCIGANSGPSSTSDYSKNTDNYERIFIGSQSKFNGGTAVLEVHNLDTKRTSIGGGYDDDFKTELSYYCDLYKCTRSNNSTVVINGNLLVRGTTFVTSKHKGGTSFAIKAIEHTSGQLEPGPGGDGWGDYATWYPDLSSDRRLKYVGKENTDGLAKLRQLKIFNYTFKKDETKTPRVGVIAQDLQKIFPNAVKKGTDGFLTIRMEDMFYAVINAIKELDLKYQAQQKRIDELEKRIKVLESKIK